MLKRIPISSLNRLKIYLAFFFFFFNENSHHIIDQKQTSKQVIPTSVESKDKTFSYQ
jgi:isopentenyldiphosphate isomerase